MTMTLAQTRDMFVATCNRLDGTRNDRVAVLWGQLRGLLEAVYAPRMNVKRRLDDLVSEGAVGLVEGIDAGHVGEGLLDHVLEYVEANRRRACDEQRGSVKGDVIAMDADQPCPRPGPEELVSRKQTPGLWVRPVTLAEVSRRRDLKPAIARLNKRDRDIISMYYRRGMSVRAIGAKIGMTGAGVGLRLRRIRERLRVLLEIPELTASEIRADLRDVVSGQRIEGYDPLKALAVYYETRSQSETAERLGVAQERVCYTVTQAVRRCANVRRLSKYHRAFSLIQRNGKSWSRRSSKYHRAFSLIQRNGKSWSRRSSA